MGVEKAMSFDTVHPKKPLPLVSSFSLIEPVLTGGFIVRHALVQKTIDGRNTKELTA